MNRSDRLDAAIKIIVWAKKRKRPVFRVENVQRLVTGVPYHRCDGYSYRVTLKILHEMVEMDMLEGWSTAKAGNFFWLKR